MTPELKQAFESIRDIQAERRKNWPDSTAYPKDMALEKEHVAKLNELRKTVRELTK